MSHKRTVRRRHRSPSERLSGPSRRQINAYGGSTMEGVEYHPEAPSYSTGSFITGPLTFTVVRTITAPPTQNPYQPSASPTSIPDSAPPASWGPSSSTSLVASTSSSQTPRSTIATLTRSAQVEQESASPQSPEETEASSKAAPLPPGAAIGLIIAGIFITIALIAYFVRRRYVRRRITMRKEWARSKSGRPAPESGFDFSFGETHSSSQFSPAPSPFIVLPPSSPTITPSLQPVEMISRGSPLVATHFPPSPSNAPRPPAVSYGTDHSLRPTNYAYAAKIPAPSTVRSPSPTKKLLTPVYGPATVLPKPLSAMVVSTFVTNLPDELDVSMGEIVHIVAEFDDDWALCSNSSQVRGMVPLECLDRSASGRGRGTLGVGSLGRGLGGRLKRVSSLNPKLTVSGRL